jgi:hypothetical protein
VAPLVGERDALHERGRASQAWPLSRLNASMRPATSAAALASSVTGMPRTVTVTTLPSSSRRIVTALTSDNGTALAMALTAPPMPSPIGEPMREDEQGPRREGKPHWAGQDEPGRLTGRERATLQRSAARGAARCGLRPAARTGHEGGGL